MTLALQVSVGALAVYFLILFVRWCNLHRPTQDASHRAAIAAVALSSATLGGGNQLLWAMSRNIGAFLDRGSTTFTFAGNLPPGVDEDDLLIVLTVGMLVLVGQACAEVWRACR